MRIEFEPREFWKRKDSANPLAAASSKSRKVISSTLLMGPREARSSWSVVAGGLELAWGLGVDKIYREYRDNYVVYGFWMLLE